MNMKKYILFFAFVTITIMASAQYPQIPEEKPNIEVTGSAEMEVEPDEIFVNIILREKNKGGDRGRIEVQEDQLLQKLKQNDFDLTNLSLSGADGELQHRVFRKNKVITEKKLLMKLKNAGEVNKLFQILDELEIEDAGIARTSHSKLEQFRKEVKVNAMKAAKEKATYLLESIGEHAGKPLVVREQQQTYPSNIYGMSNLALQEVVVTGYGTNQAAKGLEGQLGFTKIKISSEIYAKFEIQ